MPGFFVMRRHLLRAMVLVLALLCLPFPALAEDGFGNCQFEGRRNSHPITHTSTPGTLVVLTRPDPGRWNCLPGEMFCRNGFVDGAEFCMFAEIAQRGGLGKLQVLDTYGEPEETKGWDLATSYNETPERKRKFDFSIGYEFFTIGVLTTRRKPVNEKSIKTTRLGVDSHTRQFAEAILRIRVAEEFGDNISAREALLAGKVDAVLMDAGTASIEHDVSAAYTNGKLVIVGRYRDSFTARVTFPKNSALREEIDTIIQSMIDDGTIARLQHKYLKFNWGRDPVVYPLWSP